MNFIRAHKNSLERLLGWSLAFTLIFGCATRPPRTTPPDLPKPETPYTPRYPEPIGPPLPTTPSPETPAAPGTETQKHAEPVGVALVLGGAGVASFATVGLLKRFHEEGIRVNFIVATGWPALFALGKGYLKSVHDLEWFAMRLQESDFRALSKYEPESDANPQATGLVENSFHAKDLQEAKTPIILSATNTDLGDPEIFDHGDWELPLAKTMSIPGLYRGYPAAGFQPKIAALQGLDAEEARRREGKVVVSVQMYEDYLNFAKKDSGDKGLRKGYLAQIRKSLAREAAPGGVIGKIVLGKDPLDYSQRRAAIFAGYKEGTRLAKLVRPLLLEQEKAIH
jgi:hypothetical protein